MKKLLLIVALLTISLTVCFGQAAVSGWGRGIFIPVVAADGDPQSGTVASWYHGGPRIGFTISGSSDNVGAHVDILFDGNAVGVGDQAKIWVKPVEMLTLSIGMIFDDTLRGNAGFCAYNWLRFDAMTGDDMVFERIGAKGMQSQFVASIAPVDGAYIVMGLGRTVPSWKTDTDVNLMKTSGVDNKVMENMFKQGQYAVGYDIPGIGLMRAQFIGYPSATDDLNGLINAAFKLTMVEGLMLDIGGKIPMDSEQAGGKTAEIDIYANYTMDTLVLHLAGDIHINEEIDFVNLGELGFGVAVGVEYGLDGGLTIQADARYRNSIALNVLDDEGDGLIGGGIFAKWSYSNGIFGLGLEVVNTNYTFEAVKEDPTAMVIAIPIRLEYWF
jgi:hypothetical protein